MNYPTISEYNEAIRFAEDNFATLTNLRPVLDDDGNLIMSSGNFAVVFKMTDGEKNYAVKCFIKEQEGRDTAYKQISSYLKNISSKYLASIDYLEDEFFVSTTTSSGNSEFPVLVMDWIEGITLDKYIKDFVNTDRERQIYAYRSIKGLALNFIDFALWMSKQEFAHGDLKPDNIIITNRNEIVLVDYDGMFVPMMKGQKARELGTPNYRHPNRQIDDFNSSIDDFSLSVIAFSLAALTVDRAAYNEEIVDAIVLSDNDFRNINNPILLNKLQFVLQNRLCSSLYSSIVLQIVNNKASIDFESLFDIKKYINFTPPLYLPYKITDKLYRIYNTVNGKSASKSLLNLFSDCRIVNEKSDDIIILVANGGEISDVSTESIDGDVIRIADFIRLQDELKKPKPDRYALINKHTDITMLQWYSDIKPISSQSTNEPLFIAKNTEGMQGVITSERIVIPHIYKSINLTKDKSHIICENENGEKGLYSITKNSSIALNVIDVKYKGEDWHYKDGASEPCEIIIFRDSIWKGYDLERKCFINMPICVKRVKSWNGKIICVELWDEKGLHLYNCDTDAFINNVEYEHVYFSSFENNGIALCETEEHKNILVFSDGTHFVIPFEDYSLVNLGSSSDGATCFYDDHVLKEPEYKRGYDLEITIFDYGLNRLHSIIYHWDHYGIRAISVHDGKIIIGSYSMKYDITTTVAILDFYGNPIKKEKSSSDSVEMQPFEKQISSFDDEELLRHYCYTHYVNKKTIPSYDDFYEGFECQIKNGYAKIIGIHDVDPEFGVYSSLIGYADKERFYWNEINQENDSNT